MSSALQSWQGEQAPAYRSVFAARPDLLCIKPFSTCQGLWAYCSDTGLGIHVPSSSASSAREAGSPDWHMFRSYRLVSLLRYLEPIQSPWNAKKGFNCHWKVLIKPIGKSWYEGQEAQFNVCGFFFFLNNYLLVNVFNDFFDVLIIVEAQQDDRSLLTYI